MKDQNKKTHLNKLFYKLNKLKQNSILFCIHPVEIIYFQGHES